LLGFRQGHVACCYDDVESGHDGRAKSGAMPTLEERVADLEARMKLDLREEMLRGFERIEGRLDRFEGRTDSRLLALEQKVDRHFVWIVGIQLTTMLTIIGVLAAAYFH
jgi:hypothetical protein